MNEDKSVRYHRLKRRASVASLVGSAAVPLALLATGGSWALRDLAAALAGDAPVLTVALYALAFVLLHEALTLPLAFYSDFQLERRYGLSSEPFRAWLRDHAKALLINAVFVLFAAHVAYTTLRTWPSWWWLIAAGVFAVVAAALAGLFPTLLLPLFYRFRPLERPSLRGRLEALSRRAGVPVVGVFEWGLGAKTRRANAALVGLGGTRRILLSDTLLAEYSDDEIEVILAHEMAHHVHGDIPKALAAEAALLVAALGAAAFALERWGASLGLQSRTDVAGLPLLIVAAGAVMLAATPALNALSRSNERRADAYALRLTGHRAAFISAMRRVAAQNLAETTPSRLAVWLFHSHPPIEERIRMARGTDAVGSGGTDAVGCGELTRLGAGD